MVQQLTAKLEIQKTLLTYTSLLLSLLTFSKQQLLYCCSTLKLIWANLF